MSVTPNDHFCAPDLVAAARESIRREGDCVVSIWRLGLSVDLQEKLRQEGKFAPWMKIGRRVFYVRTEFERWLDEQKVKSMAGRGGAANED